MNESFHQGIVEASGNEALARALSLNDKLPFAAAGALLGGDTEDPDLLRQHREVLSRAQGQHRVIVDALERGQGARVEALMREHALAAHSNIALFRTAIPGIQGMAADCGPDGHPLDAASGLAAHPAILGDPASGGNPEEEEYDG